MRALLACLLGAGLTACSVANGAEQLPVPTFSEASSTTSAAAPQRIGLPEDCATLMTTDELGALFARPLGSTALRTVRGVPEPTVKRTERIGCRYSVAGQGGGNTLLDINIGRYTDAAAAKRQWLLNTNAERSGGVSRDLTIGAASAVAVERSTETVLAVVFGVDTLTFVLPASARAPGAPVDKLVDLALRVLQKDAPTQPPSADTATGGATPTPQGPPPAAAAG